MGAFDGLIGARGIPDRFEDYEYVPGQTAFRLTKDFTLDDFIKRFKHAESVCSGKVWIPSGRKGISDIKLDLWYADALIQHLLSIKRGTK